MKRSARPRKLAQQALTAVVLAIFSVGGLAAGTLTRQVASAMHTKASASPQSTPDRSITTAFAPGATLPTSTAPATATATSVQSDGFSLRLRITPDALRAGQVAQITASAVATDGSTPVTGVRCVLSAGDASGSLVSSWPDAQVTSSGGQVSWNVQVPDQTAPGTYKIQVSGDKGGYHAWYANSVTISV